MKNKIILGVFLAVGVFLSVYFLNQKPKTFQPSQLETKTSQEAEVSIAVTPYLSEEKWSFEIVLNTHSIELNENLAERAFLKDESGREYKPIEWQGGIGGHHLSGALVFSPLKERLNKLKLVMNDVYGVKERIFEWNLK